MSFFFNDSKAVPVVSSKMPLHSAKLLGCKICPLNRANITSPKMDAEGAEDPDVYFLFSKVSHEQDLESSYERGEDVDYLLDACPDDILASCRLNAVINCFSKKAFTELELTCCRIRVEGDIIKTKPKVLVTVGSDALSWALNETNERLYAGKLIPLVIGNHSCWLYHIHDPSFIISKQKTRVGKDGKKTTNKTEWDKYFKDQLEYLNDFLGKYKAPWIPTKEEQIKDCEWAMEPTNENLEKIFKWLDYYETIDLVSLDIETNQISTYKSDSRLLSISVGTYDHVVAFPYQYKGGWWNPDQHKRLHDRLVTFFHKVKKFVCHNAKFEQEWIGFTFGKTTLDDWTRWECTQAQAYSINELGKTHSLDFLIRQYFGFNLKIISNLDRTDLEKYTFKEILPYNCLDVKWTYALFEKQSKILKELGIENVYKDLIRSSATLAKTQINGVVPDKDVTLEFFNEYDSQLKEIQSKIKNLKDVKKYESRYGTFNYDSPTQVSVFLKNICGFSDELIVDGKESTDESVLSRIDHPFGNLLLEHRATAKKKGTYIDPIFKHAETVDGRIHASFNHLFASTGRLSSSDPNLQNFPNRKGKEVRKVICAPPGHWMVCSDYGQIEGRLIAVATQDPTYCKMIWEDYDVHLDWAKRIAEAYPPIVGGDNFVEDEKAIKKFRKDVKNQWTFPQFYGSSIYSIAPAMKIPIKVMLEINEEFWGVFSGIKEWQKWLVKFYNKHGYVETLMGFRRHGPLSYNEIINSPIQGTAARLCVNAMNKICDAGIETVMQIHDDVTSYIPDDKLEEQIDLIAQIMCDTSDYPWLNVPISVEMTCGYNWYEQEEVGVFKSTDFIEVPKKLHKTFDFYK